MFDSITTRTNTYSWNSLILNNNNNPTQSSKFYSNDLDSIDLELLLLFAMIPTTQQKTRMRRRRRRDRDRHDLIIISPNSNLNSRRMSFLAIVVVAILVLLAPDLTESVTHLRLNKASGSIEPVHDSAFTLQRPFDLVSLLAQIERVYRLDKIKKFMATQQATDNLESCKKSFLFLFLNENKI